MRGGRHRCIRSHCIAFDCTPAPPILLLPRSIQEVKSYRVVMPNNQLYANVVRNDSALQGSYTDGTVDQYFVEHVDGPDGVFTVAMEGEQENIRGQTEAWRIREDIGEATVLDRRIGLSDDAKPISVHELPFPGKECVETERDFEVRPANQLANDASGDLFGRMFPHLFPFGRGHSGEKRKVPVSLQECV
ncbi:hypothetical protein JG687_00017152 [Phytophthora cactorum]|uniref:Uncharacterized protein n=1 Tax=Phytophthora cactorum TaxID=29920 RepID=A0A8T1TP08_9STRA|nr:hypothetical protein JG687_00017152 [Phytophthora cactorum]